MNRNDQCPACSDGLVPDRGCTCVGNVRMCIPVICPVCGGTGIAKHQARQRSPRAA